MKHLTAKLFLATVLIYALVGLTTLHAQRTVGLMQYDNRQSYNGYTLFAPMGSTITYLVDNCGNEVHRWKSDYVPGLSVYMLDDGSILRAGQFPNPIFMSAGGYGGIVERIAWDGTLLWSYRVSSDSICQHHDAYPMPNGNVMIIAWDRRSAAEAVALGRVNLKARDVFSEKLMEVKPTSATEGEVVWEWKLWDHLIEDVGIPAKNYGNVSDHPEMLDINCGNIPPGLPDWIHLNSVDYNADRDQLLLSCHNLSEIWIIDHSTTTAEAAEHVGGKSGHGGDFLYRWGNPLMYKTGTKDDQKLGVQHNAHWIAKGLVDAGSIMVFNNRAEDPSDTLLYSSVDIIKPVFNENGSYELSAKRFLPESAAWRYLAEPTTSFYSSYISSAQRLSNGNTLICSGANGDFFEINSANKIVWNYVNPVSTNGPIKQGTNPTNNPVFRCVRYSLDHPAFKDKSIASGLPIELNALPNSCTTIADVKDNERATTELSIRMDGIVGPGDVAHCQMAQSSDVAEVRIVDLQGATVATISPDFSNGTTFEIRVPSLAASDVYMLVVRTNAQSITRKFVYLSSH